MHSNFNQSIHSKAKEDKEEETFFFPLTKRSETYSDINITIN